MQGVGCSHIGQESSSNILLRMHVIYNTGLEKLHGSDCSHECSSTQSKTGEACAPFTRERSQYRCRKSASEHDLYFNISVPHCQHSNKTSQPGNVQKPRPRPLPLPRARPLSTPRPRPRPRTSSFFLLFGFGASSTSSVSSGRASGNTK